MSDIATLIIGAGPAGLALAGRLTKLGLPYTLLEQSQVVGKAWHDHYDRLHLHTVKQHSALPHLPYPQDYPVYVSRQKVIEYFELYCKHFHINPLFGQEVVLIKRDNDGWITKTKTSTFHSQRVVVATGYNRSPYTPIWEGLSKFKGTILHSNQYRNPKPFVGQKVLIIGIGNTGAEIALDLYEHGALPFISVRGPVNVIKRDILGRPAQLSAIMFSKLGPKAYDWIARRIQRWTVGDLTQYGLPASTLAPSEQIRKFGKIPVIDIGTIDLIKAGKVKVLPDIQHFNESTVTFKNGQEISFDSVIVATGYRPKVEDFVENAPEILNERGYPAALWFDDKRYDELYFLGFSLPATGILRNINMESEKIAERIRVRSDEIKSQK